MPSNSGSPEPPRECPPGTHSIFDPCPGDCGEALLAGGPKAVSMAAMREALLFGFPQPDAEVTAGLHASSLTAEEQGRLADGEPYCFRCGKPASSFDEYDDPDGIYTRVEYVHNEEGTWNPATNRFACDACYIAIGMPAGPGGWQAP